MARKGAKLVSLLNTLRNIRTIDGLRIDKIKAKNKNTDDVNQNFSEGDLIAGSFQYQGDNFSFIDAPSSEMGLHRISCEFAYHKNLIRNDLTDKDINHAIKKFNDARIGLKVSRENEITGHDKDEVEVKDYTVIINFMFDIITTGNPSAVDKDSILVAISILASAPDFFLDLISKDSSTEGE